MDIKLILENQLAIMVLLTDLDVSHIADFTTLNAQIRKTRERIERWWDDPRGSAPPN